MSKVHIILTKAREAKGINIEEIAEQIRIRPQYLRALESGHTVNMLSDVYSIGYLKIYSDYLGLNTNRVIEQFKSENGNLNFSENYTSRTEREYFNPNRMMLLTSLLMAFIIYLIWSTTNYSKATLESDFKVVQTKIKEQNNKKTN